MKKLDLTYKHIILYVLTFLIIVLGDQITKVIVDHTLQLGGAYTIILHIIKIKEQHGAY